MRDITDSSFETLPIDMVLAWTIKALAPIFFIFILARFLMVGGALRLFLNTHENTALHAGRHLACFLVQCHGSAQRVEDRLMPD